MSSTLVDSHFDSGVVKLPMDVLDVQLRYMMVAVEYLRSLHALCDICGLSDARLEYYRAVDDFHGYRA